MTKPYALLFPGQGSQFVGMGAGLFDEYPDELGATADDILGWPLRAVCLGGPEEELTRTDRAQAALYALSVVLWGRWQDADVPEPAAASGHSLGEYSALAAAGAFDFADGLRLVAARGEAMAAAAAQEPSGMVAALGGDAATAEQVAADRRADGGWLWVANLNAPGQTVLAGGEADIEWLSANARDLGFRRAVPLKVAGAFHSPFMEPAVDAFRPALAGQAFAEPAFPVWANASATPVGAADLAESLAAQLVSPVRFTETLAGMAEAGIGTFVHLGPGDVTAGMVKRAVPEATVHVANDLVSVDAITSELNGS